MACVQKKLNVFFINAEGFFLELVSKELNHFGVIADLFRQIRGHSIVWIKTNNNAK